MLKLNNIIGAVTKALDGNLNTSHVKVKLILTSDFDKSFPI